MKYRHSLFPSACAVLMAAALTACGGGGSAAPAATASVSGTAATGAAIASGTVTLKCVSGTTTAATTGTDGSFSIDVSSVTLPCVGRVDYKDAGGAAQKLHTFISAAGTANITPITELLVANVTGGTAADAFDKFDGTKAKVITVAQVKAAADAVKSYLKNTLGVDTTNLPDDPVGSKFVATAGSTAGDKADKVLDDLAAKLKAGGKKLVDAAGDLAKGGGGSTTGGSSPGTLVVTNATKTSRNGSFAVDGALFKNTDSSGYNGSTKDGLFETETSWDNVQSKVIKAAVWYFEGAGSIIFFACDNGQSKPCSGVTYDPASKKLTFSNSVLPETGGTGSVTVNGSINVQ